MFHAGTTIRPGKNIDFSLDKKGRMYINASGSGGGEQGELPWCKGYFQDRSIGKLEPAIITPIFTDGDSSLIQGNGFVVPKDGVYFLSITPSATVTGIYVNNSISLNGDGILPGFLNTISAVDSPDVSGLISSISAINKFKEGDILEYYITPYTATNTIHAHGLIPKFTFARIG